MQIPRPTYLMKSWSEKEEGELKDFYPVRSSEWLVDRFDRSMQSISRKASRLDVSRHDDFQLIESVRNSANPHFPDEEFNNYIVGFVDGEGSFVHTGRGNGSDKFVLSIGLEQRDHKILEEICEYLGVGSVGTYSRVDDSYSDEVRYSVQNYGDIVSVVIPFFDDNPPRAEKKSEQYRCWRDKAISYSNFNIERFK